MPRSTGSADAEQTVTFLRRNIERLAQAGPEVGYENWARHLSGQMPAVIDSRHPDCGLGRGAVEEMSSDEPSAAHAAAL